MNVDSGLKFEETLSGDFENRDLSKAILEMLHINKLSVPQLAKPHPYMKQIYHLLSTQESRQRGDSDGTLVQSFRSVQGKEFNIYSLAQKLFLTFFFFNHFTAAILIHVSILTRHKIQQTWLDLVQLVILTAIYDHCWADLTEKNPTSWTAHSNSGCTQPLIWSREPKHQWPPHWAPSHIEPTSPIRLRCVQCDSISTLSRPWTTHPGLPAAL